MFRHLCLFTILVCVALSSGCRHGEKTSSCRTDADCPSDQVCRAGVCGKPAECAQDADCDPNEFCDLQLKLCVRKGCSSHEECDKGQVCSGGSCIAKPDSSLVHTCRIEAPCRIIREREIRQFLAAAYNVGGDYLPGQTFMWASSNAQAVEMTSDGKAMGGPSSGVSSISATVAGSSIACDPVAVVNHSRLAGGSRAVIVDNVGGLPVAGARVVAGTMSGVTDETGAAAFEGDFSEAVVAAFHPEYFYTVAEAAGARDIVIPLKQNLKPRESGGIRGKVSPDTLGNAGVFKVIVAGLSFAVDDLDFDLETVFGRPVQAAFRIEGAFDGKVAVPSGVIVFNGEAPVKETFQVSGAPGRRVPWAIGGGVSLEQASGLFSGLLGTAGEGLPEASWLFTLAYSLPGAYRHGVGQPLEVKSIPWVQDVLDDDGDGDTEEYVPDTADFDESDRALDRNMNLRTTLVVPELPCAEKIPCASVSVLGGFMDGKGLVPLAVVSAVDVTGPEGYPDGLADDPSGGSTGRLRMRISSAHPSMEAGRFLIFSLALPVDRGGASSLSLEHVSSIGEETSIPPFENFIDGVTSVDSGRTLRVEEGDTGASERTIYRITVEDGAGGGWRAFSSKPEVSLPQVPDGYPDRLPRSVAVARIRLKEPHSLSSLIAFSDYNLSALADVSEAMSVFRCVIDESGTCAEAP